MRPEAGRASVIKTVMGDVTGDGIPDKIYITGVKTPNSPFIQNIMLNMQNGKTKQIIQVKPKENAGYGPTLFLGDFTGNGVKDVLLQIDSGGSGAITYNYIYAFPNNQSRLLFDSDVYNEAYQYKVQYENYYMVRVVSEKNRNKYLIDISYRGPEYLNEIYDYHGVLKEPIEGFVDPISVLQPVDFDRDGVYELMVFQHIAGRYHADTLGYIQNVLKWDQKAFRLTQQYVAIMGTEMK